MVKKSDTKIYNFKTPAKINVGLRVLSKRKDGFHNLETIFHPIEIFDNIKLTVKKLPVTAKNSIIKVTSQPKGNISGNKNICYKTVERFFEEFGIIEKYNVTVNIKKNIPMGAGLGGGSSDAAGALIALLKYFRIKCKPNEILRFAQDVGSDVPFFLIGKPAYATGRGEKLTPLPKFKIKGKILLVNPGIHISTPWAFKQLSVKNSKKKIMDKTYKFILDDERLMINDFERVVFKKYPEIEKIKYDMYMHGADYALMSGSGSTVYGIFSNGKTKNAEKYFKSKKYKVFVS